jgi:hypothetical protein
MWFFFLSNYIYPLRQISQVMGWTETGLPTPPPFIDNSDVYVQLNSGANVYWIAFAISNDDGQVTKVEFEDSGAYTTWTSTTYETWG